MKKENTLALVGIVHLIFVAIFSVLVASTDSFIIAVIYAFFAVTFGAAAGNVVLCLNNIANSRFK